MKKTKPTIRSLKMVNTVLENGYRELQDRLKAQEQKDWELRKSICDILEKRDEFGGYRGNTSSEVKSWADIKASIARLTGLATKEGQMVNRLNYQMDAENARLWYLMRVAMRDPLLQVPVRPDVHLDIFGNEPPRDSNRN